MKTDTIFYRLFQSFPSIFFELINQPPETAIAYQFSSELKQTKVYQEAKLEGNTDLINVYNTS